MKKILIILLLVLLVGGGFLAYRYFYYDMYEVPDDVTINLNDNEFTIYDKHMSSELVESINAEITSKDVLLQNTEIGAYIHTIEYMYKKRKYKYDIAYQVKDDVPPIFISAPANLTMEASDLLQVCDKIVYADNYDNIPSCTIEGTYDKEKIGTYNNLEYVITDNSDNETRKKFTLNVVDKITTSNKTSTPNYLYIADIINNYKTDETSIGIDVSKWQGKVDFQKVKDAGIEFVIMRIGSSRSPGDDIVVDERFEEYYKACKELGLKVGVYVYNVSISRKEGIKTAKWVMDKLNGDKLDLPIAYDFEEWKNFMDFKISLHTLIDAYKGFEEEVNKNGYQAMLYSSKYYLENVWMDYEDTNIWLAHYTSKTDYKGDYMLWQMTSIAKVPGITENTVDIDILYKNK